MKIIPYVPTGMAALTFALAAACGTNSTSVAARETSPAGVTPSPTATAGVPAPPGEVLTGKEALGDWTTDAPGVRRKITVNDLPPPYASPSSDNGPGWAERGDRMPKAPSGFAVNIYRSGLANPRVIVTAPNGDIFVAESEPRRGEPGNIKVLRDTDGDGKADVTENFATGLKQPFGIDFYPVGSNPQWVYVAQTDSVIRFPYKNGDTKATGGPETVVDTIPGGGRLRGGGHWTRDLQFSADGKRMFVSVGSLTNVNQENNPQEEHRARIFSFDPDGKNGKVYATGIRNPVGLAIQPGTGTLWTSVNERDGLGDNLVPDYITHVEEGGFYGWPWYYLGGNEDPRHKGARPDLKGKVLVPDVLLKSHYASLDLAFYTGRMFPAAYQGNIFASEHGSWNRARRVGYKVIRVPIGANGKATGEYEDFLTGFVIDNDRVWGRPVGVTVAKDGALLVTDDGSGTVWRVATERK
ncbi:MAG: sorbosone dehydrogenase family protein [Capsulimonadales bacterium]|nr:sorbosone dehydrogenase family protein [Capsulimonadales bacterium]